MYAETIDTAGRNSGAGNKLVKYCINGGHFDQMETQSHGGLYKGNEDYVGGHKRNEADSR